MIELVKENVNLLHVKSRAVSQLTFDEDYNVPDARPDVGRMIQHKGEVRIEEVRLGENRASLQAVLAVDLLYVGDGEDGRVYSLTAQIPVEETLNLEGVESGDKVCLKWEIEDLSLHRIHSRKINIRSIVTFYAVVDEAETLQIPAGVRDPEGLSLKKEPVRLMELAVRKKDTMRVREEISLASNKPNIYELLWNTMEVRGLDIRAEEGKVAVRGELFLFVLYSGEEEGNPLQWMEYSLPFHGEVECADCTLEMIPDVETAVLSRGLEVKPDADGEERILQAEVVLELDMKLYREQEHELLRDLYTPLRECVPARRQQILEHLLVRNYSKCRVNERARMPGSPEKILQICHSCGRVKVDETRMTEDGILAEGVVQVKVLYIVGNDDMPFYSAEFMVPFSHTVEAPGIDDACVYRLRAELEQLSTTMADSSELEIKLILNLNALVVRQTQELLMEQVEEQPLDPEKMERMPGITVYYVRPRDTLWDIARNFYTTVDEIRELNSLESEEVESGQPLILVKKVEN